MQQSETVIGMDRGVEVTQLGEAFAVAFSFDREMVGRIRKIAGAEFKDNVWQVPQDSKEALLATVLDMRGLYEAIEKDRANIMELATAHATLRQQAKGHLTARPQVSDFHKAGVASYGEIMNVNARFAAQLTGFGRDDGAAFVTVHRLADLNTEIFKGDDVKITYDEKGRGAVSARQERKINNTLGEMIDGVKVDENGEKLHISFAINPVLEARLRRVDGVIFNKDAQAFIVPVENREFAMRAVYDMRTEFTAEMKERAEVEAIALTKVDNAVVRDAFTKDGQKQFGIVVGQTDRFIVQSAGQGQFKVHRKESLSVADLITGNNYEIAYNKGRGTVTDKTQQKAQAKGKEAGMAR